MNEDFNEWWDKYGEMFLRDFDPALTPSQIEQFKMALEGAYGSGDAKGSIRTLRAWGDSVVGPMWTKKEKEPQEPQEPQAKKPWWKWLT